ncbi:MAG: hypothetical protein HFF17_11655 [Oscillospiraceae bacterium]|nr:hypothetical protein [Oscillospiraceae bacterium]
MGNSTFQNFCPHPKYRAGRVPFPKRRCPGTEKWGFAGTRQLYYNSIFYPKCKGMIWSFPVFFRFSRPFFTGAVTIRRLSP